MTSGKNPFDQVLQDPQLQRTIAQLALATGAPEAALIEEAAQLFSKLAAERSETALSLYSFLLDKVFRRMFSNIVVDAAAFDTVRAALRRGAVVFVPNHRSHVDYLLLSHLCCVHGVPAPYIAAGENLSFFPMGYIFRKGGAFFLRRAFKGDALYTAVFRAYVTWLLGQGLPLEFFLEGGRSRSGRMLSPKTGMLSIVADALLGGQVRDALLVPVSITYERAPELGTLLAESRGETKARESARTLLAVPGKILRGGCGQVFVDFGAPISTRDFLTAGGWDGATRELGPDARRRELVTDLADRLTRALVRVGRISCSALLATALLEMGFEIDEAQLVPRARRLRDLLLRRQVRLAPALGTADFATAIRDGLARFCQNGLLMRRPIDGERRSYHLLPQAHLDLEYHRNGVLQALAEEPFFAERIALTPTLSALSAAGSV